MKYLAPAAALVGVLVSPLASASTMDANLELDNTYQNKGVGLTQGGRVEVNLSAKGEADGSFVAAKGTLLIKKDGTTGTDDMWVQAGNASADLKLGRFEAADMFPLGKDTLVLGGDTAYKANTLRGRTSQFHGALTAHLGDAFAIELGLIEEKAKAVTCADPAATDPATCEKTSPLTAAKGVRPVFMYTTGGLTLKLGVEAMKSMANENQTGLGLTGGYTWAESNTINVSIARNQKADAEGAGFSAILGSLGFGAFVGKTDGVKSDSVYAAYSFPLFGIKDATITPAISSGKIADGTRDSGGRVRINYKF